MPGADTAQQSEEVIDGEDEIPADLLGLLSTPSNQARKTPNEAGVASDPTKSQPKHWQAADASVSNAAPPWNKEFPAATSRRNPSGYAENSFRGAKFPA